LRSHLRFKILHDRLVIGILGCALLNVLARDGLHLLLGHGGAGGEDAAVPVRINHGVSARGRRTQAVQARDQVHHHADGRRRDDDDEEYFGESAFGLQETDHEMLSIGGKRTSEPALPRTAQFWLAATPFHYRREAIFETVPDQSPGAAKTASTRQRCLPPALQASSISLST